MHWMLIQINADMLLQRASISNFALNIFLYHIQPLAVGAAMCLGCEVIPPGVASSQTPLVQFRDCRGGFSRKTLARRVKLTAKTALTEIYHYGLDL